MTRPRFTNTRRPTLDEAPDGGALPWHFIGRSVAIHPLIWETGADAAFLGYVTVFLLLGADAVWCALHLQAPRERRGHPVPRNTACSRRRPANPRSAAGDALPFACMNIRRLFGGTALGDVLAST
jgi:hypothetical protein